MVWHKCVKINKFDIRKCEKAVKNQGTYEEDSCKVVCIKAGVIADLVNDGIFRYPYHAFWDYNKGTVKYKY